MHRYVPDKASSPSNDPWKKHGDLQDNSSHQTKSCWVEFNFASWITAFLFQLCHYIIVPQNSSFASNKRSSVLNLVPAAPNYMEAARVINTSVTLLCSAGVMDCNWEKYLQTDIQLEYSVCTENSDLISGFQVQPQFLQCKLSWIQSSRTASHILGEQRMCWILNGAFSNIIST